jgi:competence protein ComFC
MFKFLKDILAPKKCYSCNKEWHFLCEQCLSSMSSFDSICYVCKWKSSYFNVHNNCLWDVYYDKIIVLSHYREKTISKLIKDLKFYHKKDIVEDFWVYLSDLFIENEIYKNTEDYFILYPPMWFFKKLKRWYNHSELLAKIISANIGIKIQKNLIKKVKDTRQQSKLNRQDRLSNLENCFKVNKKYIDNIDKKIFIIIDDVISTWSTINEMSKILKNAWASKVIWLIIASD